MCLRPSWKWSHIRACFLSMAGQGLANWRRRFICNLFYDWLSTCSARDKKQAQINAFICACFLSMAERVCNRDGTLMIFHHHDRDNNFEKKITLKRNAPEAILPSIKTFILANLRIACENWFHFWYCKSDFYDINCLNFCTTVCQMFVAQ